MSHSYGTSSGEALAAPLVAPETTTSYLSPLEVSPLEVVTSEAKPASAKAGVLQQFIKFCVVGFSSTVISLAVVYFLIESMHLREVLLNALAGSPNLRNFVDSNDLHLQVASTCGFVFGVTNGFIWNSRWTFPRCEGVRRRQQYFKFFAVNIVGLVFNWLVTYVLMQILKGGRAGHEVIWEDKAAILGAIIVVSFWNFGANKLWTFNGKAKVKH